MDENVKSIEKNQTWELVIPKMNCRPIGLKWVFKLKKDQEDKILRQKYMLVVKGYALRQGIDFEEVFTLVARIESI